MHIYKICTVPCWREAQAAGTFTGMPIDMRDGYIHFSTAEQLDETARKYFVGQPNLLLLTVDTDLLDAASLKFEPARDGALFPHLYRPLPVDAVIDEKPFDTP